MVSENRVETLSCFPKQFPSMVPESKTIRCTLKFKVTTKGIWNVSEDNSLVSIDGRRHRVSVGGSKHSDAKVLEKPSSTVNSGKRRQEMSFDSRKWKKHKDLSEDTSHESSVVQIDTVSIGRSKSPQPNFSMKPSIPVNSGKWKPEMSIDQSKKKHKMDSNLKRECSKILKELMNYSFGWVFSHPVDPVKLKIPDYFQIIKNPMDLGTIKHKLERNIYSYAKEFADDVKLTFDNAKSYNGPSHEVHHWAEVLDAKFSRRWKLLEAKLKLANKNEEGTNVVHCTGNNVLDTKPVIENNCQVMKPVGVTKASIHDKFRTTSPTSLEKRHKSRPELVQVNPEKTALNGCSSLGKTVENGHCNRGASPSANTRRSVDSTESKCALCVTGTCRCIRSVAAQTSYSKLDCEFKCTPTSHAKSIALDLDCPRVVHSEEKSSRSTPATTPASFEGWRDDALMSPRKALRVAMLKSRFADTIIKATQPDLLDHGEKSNLLKMEQERQRLEKEQLKEKARIEAQIKAFEAASRRREQDDLKMRRERARMDLDKMERTVEMDNKASWAGEPGYPDYNILLRIGLRIRNEFLDEEDEDPIF